MFLTPAPGEYTAKAPLVGAFAISTPVSLPPGGGFKRRGPEPPPLSLQGDRILKERGKFEIPLSLSGVLWLLSIDMERKQLAPAGATLSLPQAKKKHPLGRKHLYSPRQRGIFISSAPSAAG